MIGTKLSNRYEILAELGRGGMGVVYRSRDPLLNREVAVKLIPPTLLSPETEQRFQREAQLVAQMDHPAIVSIFDFGRHEDSLFFVMPVVQGTNLRNFLRQHSVLGDIVDIGIQVAEALEYSHARGVVHRDIKPENLMVAREESGLRVRVMDFGLARAATESRLTKSGTLVGTMSYLSPEQVISKDVDSRSDIYSFGTVLYESIVGEPPFSGEIQSVLYRIIHELPQSPRSLGADIDEELEQAILACLAKEPAKRPQRAAEIVETLKRYRSKLRDSDRSKSVTGLTRTFQAQRAAVSPFVGRAKESAELQARLNAAVAGECQFVVVAGEPGIGKTRLVDEIETLAKVRKIRVLHGRSVEQDRSFPYQGFCEVIQEFFRLRESASAPPPDLSDVAADLVSLFPMLNEVSDVRSATSGDSKLSRAGGTAGLENRTDIYELLARTLTRIAGGRPLVVILEDLQAAEVSIEALQYIVRRLGPTATLIIGTYRPTEVDSRHPLTRMLESFRGDRRFSSILLGPFSPSEHRLFLETLVGGPELTESLVQRLFEGTEGNPFFTKELVRSLLDSGSIGRDDTGAWNLSGEAGLASDSLPATIQQAVEKRIERLPDDLRETLATAAVLGKTFDSRDLEKLAEGKSDVDDAVDRLVKEGYLEEDRESRGDVLTFSSAVVRDVLYAGLSRRKRKTLHRRYAELIEARHGGRLERVLPQLVHHFSQGDVPEKTVEYGLRLAKTSLDAFSAEEAARSARMALEFLDEEWEGDRALEGEARMVLARAERMAGDVDGALKETASAVKVLEAEGQPARAVGALLFAAETAWQARRTEDALRWAEKGLTAARASGEVESLRQLLSLAATLVNLRGEYEKANQYLEEAARLSAGTKDAETEEDVPQGGKLVVALANPVSAIEPGAIVTNEELEIAANVFETLLTTDAQGNLIPSLCEKWEGSDEGRTFVLTLRRDVRFSDGAPLTAKRLKESFEIAIRMVSSEMPAAYAAIRGVAEYRAKTADEVSGIVVRGEDKLEVHVLEPLPIYPAMLTDGSTGVVSAAKEAGGEKPRLLGTGPFRLASFSQDKVVLERNPEYWRGVPPLLDVIEFRSFSNANAIAKGFRTSEIDLARDLHPEDLEELLREPRFRRGLVEAPKKNTYFVLFNSVTGPVARNPAVRRALAGRVDTRDLVWRTLGRLAQPAISLIPPGMLGHDPGKRSHALNRDEALALLRSAGFEPPVRLKASVHPLLRDSYGALLSALFALWSEVGVEVSLATSEMASYLEAWAGMKDLNLLDLLIGRWNADYDDTDNFTHTLFHSRSGALRHYFSSPESDELLEQARSESRPAVRDSLYRKYESLLAEAAALLPLFHDIDYRLASPRVRRLTLRGTAPYVNYTELGKVEAADPATEVLRVAGGVLHVPIAGVIHTFDPALADTIDQQEVLPSTFETLTRDVGGARIVPWLAAEFKIEDGGKRYRFRLREDVRFHDGRRLTARDVRFSFERLLQQSSATENRWLFSSVRGARALIRGEAADLAGFKIHSATELSIYLEEPISFFPAILAFHGAAVVPEGSNPAAASWQEGCVGTGPYRVVKFEPGRRLELERNKTYWRKGYPRSEGLTFSFGVSPEDILSGFRAGRFSLASDLFPSDVEALRREPDFASGYRDTPRLITYFAAFATRHGPLADLGLRRRLVQAVDVPRLVQKTLGRLAIPAEGLIPPGLLGHDPGSFGRGQAAPPGAAEALSAPVELAAQVHPVFFGEYSGLARELQASFADKGVKIRVVNKTMADFLDLGVRNTVDLVVGRWSADYPDADTFVNILHSQGGSWGPLCGSAEIDQLVERGRVETSPPLRHSIYRQLEETLVREARVLPLFHEQAYRFARPEVEGLTVSFWSPIVAYETLHIRG